MDFQERVHVEPRSAPYPIKCNECYIFLLFQFYSIKFQKSINFGLTNNHVLQWMDCSIGSIVFLFCWTLDWFGQESRHTARVECALNSFGMKIHTLCWLNPFEDSIKCNLIFITSMPTIRTCIARNMLWKPIWSVYPLNRMN